MIENLRHVPSTYVLDQQGFDTFAHGGHWNFNSAFVRPGREGTRAAEGLHVLRIGVCLTDGMLSELECVTFVLGAHFHVPSSHTAPAQPCPARAQRARAALP